MLFSYERNVRFSLYFKQLRLYKIICGTYKLITTGDIDLFLCIMSTTSLTVKL
jgi:hypothetical protein